MIVSHRHKFIFLHSRKTGGSAVTLALLRLLDPEDLWLNVPSHLIMGDALRSGLVPPPATHPVVVAALRQQCGRWFTRKALSRPHRLDARGRRAFAQVYNSLQPVRPGRGRGWQHAGAADARAYLGSEIWDSYFSFAFERNPWDRLVSLYWWRMRGHGGAPEVPFREFVAAIHSGDRERMRRCRATKYSNWHIYTIEDQLAVDHLGRYETLSDDLRLVGERLGMPQAIELPRAKHDVRRSGVADMYGPKTEAMVAEIFQREIELLGYRSPVVG